MKKNISEPIAAILILNTIANTGGAAVAGMFAVDALGAAWLPLFSALFTIAILFFSEIYPKTIGAVHWRGIWPFVVYPLNLIKIILYPFIFVTQKATQSVTSKQKGKTITEDEILALVHLGAREGEISSEESAMVKNIINLEEKLIEEVMTPRKMIFSLDINSTISQATKAIQGKGFSRIPLYEGDRENIIGYTIIHDLNKSEVLSKPEEKLKSIVRKIHHFPSTINCLNLLTSFLKHRLQIAIVEDEYGGVDGLITLEDLIETVLGKEIVDETDREIDLQETARKRNYRFKS
jgi:CBS domain containing-hemolysin-like protein